MKSIYKKFFLITMVVIIILYSISNLILYSSKKVSNPEIYKADSQHIIKLLKQNNKNNQHPRLMATSKDFQNIKLEIIIDKAMKERFNYLEKQADAILKQEPVKYEFSDGLSFLSTSRKVLNRIQTLAFVYQVSGQKKYADRAWLELETISNDKKFPDWHPGQFLDTAEMTNAAAIGYDWLYNYLSANQRAVIRNAILNKGLKPAIEFYSKENSIIKGDNNWNSVCNGGIGMGALAIGDEGGEFESTSGQILQNAVKYLPIMLNKYAPDGAWYEGPTYWDYGTTYLAYFISALDSSLGTDYNLSKAPGFSSTGDFPIYMAGPGGMFNFSDSSSNKIKSPVLLWLSNKFKNGEYAWYYNKITNIKNTTAMTFIWGNKKVNEKSIKIQDKYFRQSEVVTLHSSITKSTDSFIGFKAGTNGLSHSNLDIGTFVYDALGVRWFCDLGADNYNLQGYFNGALNGQRWQYYRERAEGQNTLVINPSSKPDQNVYAKTKIETFKSDSRKSFAIADITDAYKPNAISVKRGVALYKNTGTMLIQDEIIANKSSDIWWFAHTQAKIEISEDKKSAILSKNGKRILVSILSPSDGYFSKMKAEPLPSSPNPINQAHNNMEKLTIHLTDVDDTTISVVISPLVNDKNLHSPNLVRLQDWNTDN
ncbi:heparinase II/III domain-containing protein [Clostridium pasteurianum]|uniref:Heparinase II/III-like protein n=1 Tax=Clostridium pasteurianum BC1 TaxID=86416 RepID=R4JYI6_CLOPA|nr:heparinase II/III family protein [Clostridium pasteurianum]AGK95892.1 Heparinase II/III-like protein [Clostridium pasteurianum BC1]